MPKYLILKVRNHPHNKWVDYCYGTRIPACCPIVGEVEVKKPHNYPDGNKRALRAFGKSKGFEAFLIFEPNSVAKSTEKIEVSKSDSETRA